MVYKSLLVVIILCGLGCSQAEAAGKHTKAYRRPAAKAVTAVLPSEFVLQMGHASWVTTVAFSPDGQLLASSGADGTTRLWSVQSREVLRTLSGPTAEGLAVAFSPDGTLLAATSSSGAIHIWGVQHGELLHTLRGHTAAVTAVAFSPDGRILASAGADKTLRLWLVPQWQEVGRSRLTRR